MKVKDIVEKTSLIYREARAKVSKLRSEQFEIVSQLEIESRSGYQNITHAEYESKRLKLKTIENEILLVEEYAKGIFDAREILLDIEIDTVLN